MSTKTKKQQQQHSITETTFGSVFGTKTTASIREPKKNRRSSLFNLFSRSNSMINNTNIDENKKKKNETKIGSKCEPPPQPQPPPPLQQLIQSSAPPLPPAQFADYFYYRQNEFCDRLPRPHSIALYDSNCNDRKTSIYYQNNSKLKRKGSLLSKVSHDLVTIESDKNQNKNKNKTMNDNQKGFSIPLNASYCLSPTSVLNCRHFHKMNENNQLLNSDNDSLILKYNNNEIEEEEEVEVEEESSSNSSSTAGTLSKNINNNGQFVHLNSKLRFAEIKQIETDFYYDDLTEAEVETETETETETELETYHSNNTCSDQQQEKVILFYFKFKLD
jgi:hypothetical protein